MLLNLYLYLFLISLFPSSPYAPYVRYVPYAPYFPYFLIFTALIMTSPNDGREKFKFPGRNC